jgi:hypothetical protein
MKSSKSTKSSKKKKKLKRKGSRASSRQSSRSSNDDGNTLKPDAEALEIVAPKKKISARIDKTNKDDLFKPVSDL